MAAWKDLERRVARLLGGKRIGNTGKATADVVTPWLSIECKYRASLPTWLKEADTQSHRNAEDSKLPITILFEKGRRTGDSLVLLRLSDFEQWFGRQESRVGASE